MILNAFFLFWENCMLTAEKGGGAGIQMFDIGFPVIAHGIEHIESFCRKNNIANKLLMGHFSRNTILKSQNAQKQA
jgi:hypothetical protein